MEWNYIVVSLVLLLYNNILLLGDKIIGGTSIIVHIEKDMWINDFIEWLIV